MITSGQSFVQWEERRLQAFHIQALVSVRLPMEPGDWCHDLQSPFWRIYRFSKPGAFLCWSGGRMEMAPRRIYLLPAWLRFSTGNRTGLTHDYVHFDVHGLLPGWLKQAFDQPILLPENSALDAVVKEWTAGLRRGREIPLVGFGWASVVAQTAFTLAVDTLLPESRDRLVRWLSSDPDLEAAVEAMERRLADPPSNQEMATACRMGLRQFMRRFKEATGLTPAQFSLERRILAAARWLAYEQRTIEDIAEATGFTDRFYFSRMFKARLGVSPARYRHDHRLERG